jgi:hypothetical protein
MLCSVSLLGLPFSQSRRKACSTYTLGTTISECNGSWERVLLFWAGNKSRLHRVWKQSYSPSDGTYESPAKRRKHLSLLYRSIRKALQVENNTAAYGVHGWEDMPSSMGSSAIDRERIWCTHNTQAFRSHAYHRNYDNPHTQSYVYRPELAMNPVSFHSGKEPLIPTH